MEVLITEFADLSERYMQTLRVDGEAFRRILHEANEAKLALDRDSPNVRMALRRVLDIIEAVPARCK